MKKTIVFFIYLIFFQNAFSDINLYSTHFSTNDGLANNFVRHIYQDSKGFLWMSTLNGLSRFDGHVFVTFEPLRNKKINLFDHHVRGVEEDQNHFLWIQLSPENFSCYDLKLEKFIDFTGTGDYKKKFSHRLVTSTGNTWLWDDIGGCRKLSCNDRVFTTEYFTVSNGKLPSNSVTKIIEDAQGVLYIATDKGLAVIYKDGKRKIVRNTGSIVDVILFNGTVFFLNKNGDLHRLSTHDTKATFLMNIGDCDLSYVNESSFLFHNKWVILTPKKGTVVNLSKVGIEANDVFNIENGRFTNDNKGNICIFNNQGIVRYINIQNGKIKEFKIATKDIATEHWCKTLLDSRGWVWFATQGDGLYVYNPATEEFFHYRYQVDKENFICSNSLTYVMEDRSGAIWIASESAGISRLNVSIDNVEYIFPEDKQLINSSNSIRLIYENSKKEILIGNRDGDLFKYNWKLTEKLKSTHFNSSIYTMLEDTTGDVILGSRNSGICYRNKWITKGVNSNSLPCEKISLIYKDYKKRIWIGMFNKGLVLMTAKGNAAPSFRRFFLYDNDLFSVRSIETDKNNWMWVGTDNGLYVFHPDSLIANPNNYSRYNFENGKLLANRVKCVFRDSKNRFWLGTMGGGVSCCKNGHDYKNLKFQHYTTNNGLANNVVQSILEDNKGKIWIATEYGMSRLTPETNAMENFFFSKSIQGNVYNESSALALSDHRLLFGTYHGLVIIEPDKVKSPMAISNLVFTDLKINGESVHPDDDDSPLTNSIAYSDKIELNYYQNSFSLEFSTFDFSTDKKSRYMYKLEPYDNEWSTPTALNFVTYKKLEPGSYTLRVRACNSAGIWSENEAKLEIVIHPPFWASSLAYLLYFILTIGIIYLTFRIVTNIYRLRNQLLVEHQLTDYKLTFFTNISHEFRTPLTIIKGTLEKLEQIEDKSVETEKLVQLMGKSTNRLLRLVNQLLEFRKMQYNKLTLKLEEVDVIKLMKDVSLNFEEIAANKKINFSFEPEYDSYLMYLDSEKLDKIVFNLLSNAFKYTPNKGSIVFSLKIDEELRKLIVQVIDTGVGIPVEKQHELFSRFMQTTFSKDSMGIGLHLSHELVNVHKGTIQYHDREGGGAVFTVTLPLDATIYSEADFAEKEDLELYSIASEDVVEASEPEDEVSAFDVKNVSKVLLIEDDIDINKFLQIELSHYFEVVTAFDGISGLEAAQTFDGDLIICDVLMPGMNGFDVTKKLKENFDTCHIPVILLTAMSSSEYQLQGVQCGADAYITKPFSLNFLLARISQLIEQRELLRKRFSNDETTTNLLVSVSELDQKFVDRINLIMDKYLGDADFSIDDFATKLNLGRTSFFRKVKGVTGFTPNEYMRIYRLKKALELLKTGEHNVSEVTFMVGMNDPLYFSRCFKKQFGVSPSIYLRGDKR